MAKDELFAGNIFPKLLLSCFSLRSNAKFFSGWTFLPVHLRHDQMLGYSWIKLMCHRPICLAFTRDLNRFMKNVLTACLIEKMLRKEANNQGRCKWKI
jgi:hypothetical protein